MTDIFDICRSFWDLVDIIPDGCWQWTGPRIGKYGVHCTQGFQLPAHRFLWIHILKRDASGLQVHHLCQNPCCVRPDHLVALTPKEHNAQHVEERRAGFARRRERLLSDAWYQEHCAVERMLAKLKRGKKAKLRWYFIPDIQIPMQLSPTGPWCRVAAHSFELPARPASC
jgi:hypothetical protein